MGGLRELLKHPDEVYALLKLKLSVSLVSSPEAHHNHWSFCYNMLSKITKGCTNLLIQPFDRHLRNAVCVFYLVLRALDTVEDDTRISTEIKVPILTSFLRSVHDQDWHFSCGTEDCKILMDEYHNVSTAFLELEKCYQDIIEDATKQIGAAMAKYICSEIETMEDYNGYCHGVAAPIAVGTFRLFKASGKQDFAPENLSSVLAIFLQKTNVIRDFLEDIHEVPKPRKFWPYEIWGKHVKKLEDLTCEANSIQAVQCLNEMITDALQHVEDCLKLLSDLRDEAVFRFCAVRQVLAIGTLALCYNNPDVFKTGVKIRPGLAAKIYDKIRTKPDVYKAFFEFALVMKQKVEIHDPNATETLNRLNEIQHICRISAVLDSRKVYISNHGYNFSKIIVVLMVVLA